MWQEGTQWPSTAHLAVATPHLPASQPTAMELWTAATGGNRQKLAPIWVTTCWYWDDRRLICNEMMTLWLFDFSMACVGSVIEDKLRWIFPQSVQEYKKPLSNLDRLRFLLLVLLCCFFFGSHLQLVVLLAELFFVLMHYYCTTIRIVCRFSRDF